MADLGIIWYPHIALRETSQKVSQEEISSKEFHENLSFMFSTMYYRDGVGLAAPQMGWNASLFIANPYGRPQHDTHGKIFINPSIVGLGKTVVEKEGCLSFPGIFADVERSERVNIRYQDVRGAEIQQEYDGFMARIIQHEFDHLNGVLFIDRLTDDVKELIKPKLDSHRLRVGRIRKQRNKRQRQAEARKKKRAKKRRKLRNKRKGKQK